MASGIITNGNRAHRNAQQHQIAAEGTCVSWLAPELPLDRQRRERLPWVAELFARLPADARLGSENRQRLAVANIVPRQHRVRLVEIFRGR